MCEGKKLVDGEIYFVSLMKKDFETGRVLYIDGAAVPRVLADDVGMDGERNVQPRLSALGKNIEHSG